MNRKLIPGSVLFALSSAVLLLPLFCLVLEGLSLLLEESWIAVLRQVLIVLWALSLTALVACWALASLAQSDSDDPPH